MTLGQRIRDLRVKKGLSQSQLAGNRITRNMLSLIEHDSAVPSLKTLHYLAQQLEVSDDYLLQDMQGFSDISAAKMCFQKKHWQECLRACRACKITEENKEVLLQLKARSLVSLGEEQLCKCNFFECRQLMEESFNILVQCELPAIELEEKVCQIIRLCKLELKEDVRDVEKDLRILDAQTGFSASQQLCCAVKLQKQANYDAAQDILDSIENIPNFLQSEALLANGRNSLALGRFADASQFFMEAERVLTDFASEETLLAIYAALEECFREQELYEQAYQYASKQLKMKNR